VDSTSYGLGFVGNRCAYSQVVVVRKSLKQGASRQKEIEDGYRRSSVQQETTPPAGPNHSGTFIAVFVVLAGLAVGEIYTLSQISSMAWVGRKQTGQFQKDQQEALNRFSSHVSAEAQEHTALKTEIEASAKRLGSSGGELRKARAMVADLEAQEKQQAEALKQEIAKKADQEQLGALAQDVSSTKTDLDGARRSRSTPSAPTSAWPRVNSARSSRAITTISRHCARWASATTSSSAWTASTRKKYAGVGWS